MAPLFDPARHEPLTADAWDEGRARRAIDAIVADTLGASLAGLWRTHPLDGAPAARTLYMGAAGVLWALQHLVRYGAIDDDERYDEWALALPGAYRAAPDTGQVVPSYFLGEAGVLLVALRTHASSELSARLISVITSNVDHPAREALWGAPGTALAAVLAYELTGDARFRAAYRDSVRALARSWPRCAGDAPELWTQDLYGSRRRYLGAAHGFAGNVLAFLRGSALLEEREREEVLTRAVRTLSATARVEGDVANWPSDAGGARFFVQWCHGAPGIVTSFASAPAEPELDRLLDKAAELVWRAGPLDKGPSLCHGSAGNGAALLAMFTRTGEVRWLERARAFAMHTIRQIEAARAKYGAGRYSLWTGDLGAAVYLWHCVRATSGLPSLDL